MTTLVDASELVDKADRFDQSPLQIAARGLDRLIREVGSDADADKFVQEFSSKQDDAAPVLFDLLLSKSEVVFSKLRSAPDEASLRAFEKTAEGFFTVVLSLLENFESYETITAAIDRFIDKLTEAESETAGAFTARVRIRSLMLLFNLFAVGLPVRAHILARIDAFAATSPLAKAILRAHSGDRPKFAAAADAAKAAISPQLLQTLRTTGEAPLPESPEELQALARAVAGGGVDGVIDLVDRKIRRVLQQ